MDEPDTEYGEQAVLSASEESCALSLAEVRQAPGYLVRRAHQFANAAYAAEFGPDVVTGVQFVALTAISEEPGLTGMMVAERIGYDKMTTSHVIRRLERKELITRHRSPSDGREIQISLTDAGRAAMGEISSRLSKVSEKVLAPLDPEERTLLLGLLQKLETASRDT